MPASKISQLDKFKAAAKEAGADMDETAFNKNLKRIANKDSQVEKNQPKQQPDGESSEGQKV